MSEPAKQVVEYPRLWVHKENKKRMRVMPWWETVKEGEVEQVDELGHLIAEVAGRTCKFGVLVQVGFLLENEHGVWIGVGPGAVEHFDDEGKWVPSEKATEICEAGDKSD
jgi:predicted NAD/FAD-binding protein